MNLRALKHEDSKFVVFYTRRLEYMNSLPYKTSMFQYIYGDSKISMFKPWRFLNLHVLKYGDSKISMFKPQRLNFVNKNFNYQFLNWYRRNETKFIEKKFQQHAITYTGHWFSEEEKIRKSNIFYGISMFYTRRFLL